MRLRLRPWVKRQSTKTLALLGVVGFGVVLLAGGGVYAALGGIGSPQATTDIELQRGLVGYWKLKGNAKDSTPYGNHGTVNGASLTTNRKGLANSAYSFNGLNNDIRRTSGVNGLPGINQKQSVSVWFKGDLWSGNQGLLTLTDGSNAGNQFVVDSSGYAAVYRWGGGNNITSTTAAGQGVWCHAVFTYDSTNWKIYINGVLSGVSSTAPQSGSTSSMYIGSYGGGDWWKGSIGEVRIYNRAVSAAEVAVLFKSYDSQVNAASSQARLGGWWKMDGNAKDASPYGNNGIVTGLTPTTDRKGTANAAYAFGGNNGNIEVPDNASIDATSAITISAWINPTDWAGNRRILQKAGDSQQYNMLYEFGQFKVNLTGLSAGTLAYGTPPPVGQYTLVTVTYDGAFIRLYYNATQVAFQAAVNNIVTNTAPLVIGNKPGSSVPGDSFYGKIDDLKIYRRALSASEVAAASMSYESQINLQASPTNGQTGNINSGLVGYWPFNGNTKDATPYGNNAVRSGATLPSLTTDRKGRPSSAYLFNGASGYMNTNNIFSLGYFSVAAWVNVATNATLQAAASNTRDCCGTYYGFDLTTSGYGAPRFKVTNGASGAAATGSSPIATGTWVHLVGTYDGANVKLYQGGSLVATTPAVLGAIGTPADTAKIGRSGAVTSGYINGSVDDVRIYNRPLSLTEVQTLFNATN